MPGAPASVRPVASPPVTASSEHRAFRAAGLPGRSARPAVSTLPRQARRGLPPRGSLPFASQAAADGVAGWLPERFGRKGACLPVGLTGAWLRRLAGFRARRGPADEAKTPET